MKGSDEILTNANSTTLKHNDSNNEKSSKHNL